MPEGPTVVVSVVGNVLRAKESGLLALVKEEFPGAVFHQNPEVRLGYHAPSEVISSAIKEGATHVLVAERYTDDGGVIRNLQPLAEAAFSVSNLDDRRCRFVHGDGDCGTSGQLSARQL